MSSQLNLLELYLSLKGPKVFRSFYTLSEFWWIFWAYESSGNWTDLCRWTENRARKTNVFENMQVYVTIFLIFHEPLPMKLLTSLATCMGWGGVGWGGL